MPNQIVGGRVSVTLYPVAIDGYTAGASASACDSDCANAGVGARLSASDPVASNSFMVAGTTVNM